MLLHKGLWRLHDPSGVRHLKYKIHRSGKEMMIAGGWWGRGKREPVFSGSRVADLQDEKFLEIFFLTI